MRKTPRSLAVAGLALAAGLGAVATAAPAFAAQDPILTEEQQQTFETQADAYRACLEDQGVTLPEKSTDGSKPDLTDEQRAAMKAARTACADQRPDRPELSDAQRAELQAQEQEHRACMEEQLSAAGITKPEKPAEGTRPADGQRPARPELTDEQRAAFEAARDACADTEPNLGVDDAGLLGRGMGGPGGPDGHMGRGGPGGRMGPGGPGGQSGQSGQSGQDRTAPGSV